MDDPGFWEWVKTPRSQGGGGLKSGDPIATQAAYNTLMREYLKNSGGGFQPTAIAVTNPVNTNQVIPVLTTSPNSVQPLPQPRLQYKPDKDGNLMAIEGTTANYVTNTTGERVKIDPKSNRLEDIMNALGGNEPAAEESPGFFSRIFGGVASSPAPTPTPAPTPAMTNAPSAAPAAPAPTPAVFSTADFKQMTGRDLPPGDYVDNNGRPFTIR